MIKKTATAAFLSLVALSSSASTPPLQDYQQSRRLLYSSAIPVPAEGMAIGIDVASFVMRSGTFRALYPSEDGQITGMIFEGDGEMMMEIPDRVELEQLRRFSRDETLDRVSTPFSRMVLRSSAPFLAESQRPPSTTKWDGVGFAKDRHDYWSRELFDDVDAMVLAARLDPAAQFLRADVETEAWGWVTWTYDSGQIEEISLMREQHGFTEEWISLDRSQDRGRDGRPSKRSNPSLTLQHVSIDGDLTRAGRSGRVGRTDARPINGVFEATVRLKVEKPGSTVLQLELHPGAEVLSVKDSSGNSLEFIRDHIGDRFRMVDRRFYDDDLLVLLEEPTTAGVIELTVEYELEFVNFVAGHSWYPTPEGFYLDDHTADLELTTSGRTEVHSMGSAKPVREVKDGKVWSFDITRPTRMVTFTTSERYIDASIEQEGAPKVTSLGPVLGLGRKAMIRNVAVDTSNSLRYFQWLFDDRIMADEVLVTSIAAGHGQAFDGFIHMSEETYWAESPGASELFRAHEVAHQWWGHKIGWKTYRDQWLSEAFAEYSAIMFIESTMEHGPGIRDEILSVYENTLFGSLRGAMSKYSRPWLLELNEHEHERLGPIDVGARAGTRQMPGGYQLQNYIKGPLVLHMLREGLRVSTRSDETFVAILRDFVDTYKGKRASTEDFFGIVAKHRPGDWSWFINQWIYGAEIPTLEYSSNMGRTADSEGMYPLTMTIRRSDVPDNFVIPVPIQVELPGDRIATILAVVTKDEETFEWKLPARGKKVVFNPDHAVIARVRGR